MVDFVKECVTFTRSNGGKNNPQYYIRTLRRISRRAALALV